MIKRAGIISISIGIIIGWGWLVSCQTNKLKNSKTEELKPEISALVDQLGSDDWKIREKATQELIKMGESIMPQLGEIYHSTNDPEVRYRISLIAEEHGYILDPKQREQVNQWLEQLYSPDGKQRVDAFNKLIEFGRGGIKALKRNMETPPKIKVSLVAVESTIRIGETTRLKFMVKNVGNRPVLVTPSFNRGSSSSGSNRLRTLHIGGGGGWFGGRRSGRDIRSFLGKSACLKSGESLELPPHRGEFSKTEVGIYSYRASDSYTFRSKKEEFSGIEITPYNLITSVSGETTICVLPKDEDLGKGLRITLNKAEVKTGDIINLSGSFAEGLKPAEEDNIFGLWYIILDNQMNPINYGNLSEEAKLSVLLAGSEVNLSIKCEAKLGEYQLLIGYGNCAFSQLEKIKIQPAEDTKNK